MRMRRRSRPRTNKAASTARVANTEIVIFDHGPAEFPVATAVPRELRARAIALTAALQRWVLARWEWFRPRTVPCAVAALGMVAVISAVQYLTHVEGTANTGTSARVVHIDVVAPR